MNKTKFQIIISICALILLLLVVILYGYSYKIHEVPPEMKNQNTYGCMPDASPCQKQGGVCVVGEDKGSCQEYSIYEQSLSCCEDNKVCCLYYD